MCSILEGRCLKGGITGFSAHFFLKSSCFTVFNYYWCVLNWCFIFKSDSYFSFKIFGTKKRNPNDQATIRNLIKNIVYHFTSKIEVFPIQVVRSCINSFAASFHNNNFAQHQVSPYKTNPTTQVVEKLPIIVHPRFKSFSRHFAAHRAKAPNCTKLRVLVCCARELSRNPFPITSMNEPPTQRRKVCAQKFVLRFMLFMLSLRVRKQCSVRKPLQAVRRWWRITRPWLLRSFCYGFTTLYTQGEECKTHACDAMQPAAYWGCWFYLQKRGI